MTEKKVTEHVVMTPKCKTANSTTLIIERKVVEVPNENMHVAGGDHTGIVINKEAIIENGDYQSAQLSLEFKVFLVSSQTGKHTQEARTLRFWFSPSLEGSDQAAVAQEFFKELVSPQEFPRDYVGYIKKIMKLMQLKYSAIAKAEVELRQLEDDVEPPARPPSADDNSLENIVVLTQEKVLEIIESAYPNPVTIEDMIKDNGWNEEEVAEHLAELQSRGLVKAMEHGAYTRTQHQDTQITVVKQMPTIVTHKQPTIAIITAQYCEKLAVDALIENKETFVRYTTVGESNVYTLGNIGAHKVVCTKLPSIGHTREAMTAAGNTTTRLLGTFQKVDYVFLVGVGGGVPHYTDYSKHVRLGDVVVSVPQKGNKYVYVYCDSAKVDAKNGYKFEVNSYTPSNQFLQDIASDMKKVSDGDGGACPPWMNYLNDGLSVLDSQSEQDFKAPPSDSDKLYMSIGEKGLIEVAHPAPQDSTLKRLEGCPRIHLSPVASGRQVVRDDQLRQEFASQLGILAFDCEFDAVVESIIGNCRDSFICIRGIADYRDGTRRKEWQPYASLAAASVMKSIICSMDPPTNV